MEDFQIRAYSKAELALLYFPTAQNTHSAVNRLMAWIKRYPGLEERLLSLGYRKTSKFFSSREVSVIVECLGEP